MYKIGDFSRLTRVTVKALRLYDSLGLLPPARIDRDSGYRYYSATQVPRLNRILALKDLGLALDQIGPFLDANISPGVLRTTLLVKQAEVRSHLATDQARLARIDERLKQLDEGSSQAYDVVLKRVVAQRVASIRAVLPNHQAVGELFRELAAYQLRHGITANAWTAIWHDPEYCEDEVDAEATFNSSGPLPNDGRVRERELPAVEAMACVVHHGPLAAIGGACAALLVWIEANGYSISGPERALSLQRIEQDNVTEMQIPVTIRISVDS